MLRMIAWGSELNLAHPPRPTDRRIPWEPEWNVRVRVKATTMAMLGAEISGAPEQAPETRAGRRDRGEPASGEAGQESGSLIPGVPGGAIDAIRSIFGR